MGLQFQNPNFKPHEYGDWSKDINGIFEAYQQRKAADAAEKGRVGEALTQYGFDPRQVTPEAMARASQPTPQGPAQPGMPSPEQAENPLFGALRAFMDKKKQGASMAATGAQLDQDKTRSEINENNSQAERNRRVPESTAPQIQNIKGVDYIVTANANGTPHYQPIPERQPTQSEFAAKGYSDKAQQAHNSLEGLERSGYEPSSVGNVIQNILPTAAQSKEFQGLDQSRRQFINAILRRESGAAISASEDDNYTRQYFPVPGDKPEVKAQKAEARKLAIAGLSSEGSRVASNLTASNAPAVGTIKNGYKFNGGNPADKASWVKQ